MAIDINSFKNAFSSGDYGRNNLFSISIPIQEENFQYRCKASSIPAEVVGVIDMGFLNRKIKLAGDRTYDEWTVTVYNNDTHTARDDMIAWQQLAVGTGTVISGQPSDVYKNSAIITQYDRNMNPTAEYTVSQLWPNNIGEITLDWDTNDQLETFEVTFVFDYILKTK